MGLHGSVVSQIQDSGATIDLLRDPSGVLSRAVITGTEGQVEKSRAEIQEILDNAVVEWPNTWRCKRKSP